MYVRVNLSEIMALIQKVVLSYGVLGKVGETGEATACAQGAPMSAKRGSLGEAGEQGTCKRPWCTQHFLPLQAEGLVVLQLFLPVKRESDPTSWAVEKMILSYRCETLCTALRTE